MWRLLQINFGFKVCACFFFFFSFCLFSVGYAWLFLGHQLWYRKNETRFIAELWKLTVSVMLVNGKFLLTNKSDKCSFCFNEFWNTSGEFNSGDPYFLYWFYLYFHLILFLAFSFHFLSSSPLISFSLLSFPVLNCGYPPAPREQSCFQYVSI